VLLSGISGDRGPRPGRAVRVPGLGRRGCPAGARAGARLGPARTRACDHEL